MDQTVEKFSNAQLEIIQLFAGNLNEDDLAGLKKMLLRFKAERLMDAADAAWEEKKWTNEDVKRLLQIKMRTPYQRKVNRS
jgi:hypothetical protein